MTLAPPAGTTPPLGWPQFVVERWIVRPAATLELDSPVFRTGNRLNLGAGGVLWLEEPFSTVASRPTPTWRATGRLAGRRRRVIARVVLEVSEWSDHVTELTVRPVERRLARWGARRQRRYFALAHQGADFVLQLLTR